MFSFNNGLSSSGTVTGSGTGEAVSISLNDLIFGSTGYSGTFTESYSNSTGLLTLSGTGTGLFSNLSGTFLSIQEAAGLLGPLPLNALSIYSGVTSLTFSHNFLVDLGLTSNPTVPEVKANVSVTASSNGSVTSTVTSFDVVPEPSTFVMIGTALLLAGGFSARRRFQLSRSEK